MATKPPAGQGPFQRGERLTAAKLNEVVASIPKVTVGGHAGMSGDAVLVDNPESIFLRVTGTNGTTPRKYSWVEVFRNNGTWANTTRTGNETYDWAIERNNANVTAGSTVYRAERSIDSSEWIFDQGGSGGGTVNITSGETVLMILGTYDDYKDCPNVPVSPPTLVTDYCAGTTGTELCVPAYAYAVYQRCGYVWNKVGDTRDFGVWANELNGGSTSAWRRFVIPRWGGDVDQATGLPDPASDCMGVAFVGSGASALTCSCPTWASSLSNCIKVTFRTIPRPCTYDPGNVSCGYTDCADIFTLFDAGDTEGPYWDREFSVEISGSMCSNGGQFGGGAGAGNVGIEFVDRTRTECYWGPSTFDPCNPCDGFGIFRLRIELNTEERPNCGGVGHVYADISMSELLGVLCDCNILTPSTIETCDGCDGNIGLSPLVVIDTTTIEITCCP